MILKKLLKGIIFVGTLALPVLAGPVSYYGQMEAHGNRVYGSKNGLAMEARGVSLFWNNWSGEFWNTGTVHRLADEWKVDMVRAAFNPADWPGQQGQIESVIQGALDKDIYVIIDFHTHNPDAGKAEWFFGVLAEKYGRHDNVIFEVYNEPEAYHNWQGDIKPHSEAAIRAIREHSDNLIVVGNRIWSQRADEAAADPVDDPNVAYVMHFYVGSHGSWVKNWNEVALGKPLSDETQDAVAPVKPVPIFASEWGYWPPGADNYKPDLGPFGDKNYQKCNGGNCSDIDINGYEWMEFMARHQMSWASWSLSSKEEPSSYFNGSMDARTAWGNLIMEHTQSWTDNRAPWNFAAEVTAQVSQLPKKELMDDLDDIGVRNFWNGLWSIKDDSPEEGKTKVDPVEKAVAGGELVLKAEFEYGTMWMNEPYAKAVMTLNAKGSAADLKGCTTIQYDYQGKAHNFQVGQSNIDEVDYHQTEVAASEGWSTAKVEWSRLKQPGWIVETVEPSQSEVNAFVWVIKGAGGTKGELKIDNIACIGQDAPADTDYTDEVKDVSSEETASVSSADSDTGNNESNDTESSDSIDDIETEDKDQLSSETNDDPGPPDVSPILLGENVQGTLSLLYRVSNSGAIAVNIVESGNYFLKMYDVMGNFITQIETGHVAKGTQSLSLSKPVGEGLYVVTAQKRY